MTHEPGPCLNEAAKSALQRATELTKGLDRSSTCIRKVADHVQALACQALAEPLGPSIKMTRGDWW